MSEFNIVNQLMTRVGIELLGQLKKSVKTGIMFCKIGSLK